MMLQYKIIGFDFFLYLLKSMPINFKESRREGERGRETSIGCLLHTPWPGTEPTA